MPTIITPLVPVLNLYLPYSSILVLLLQMSDMRNGQNLWTLTFSNAITSHFGQFYNICNCNGIAQVFCLLSTFPDLINHIWYSICTFFKSRIKFQKDLTDVKKIGLSGKTVKSVSSYHPPGHRFYQYNINLYMKLLSKLESKQFCVLKLLKVTRHGYEHLHLTWSPLKAISV